MSKKGVPYRSRLAVLVAVVGLSVAVVPAAQAGTDTSVTSSSRLWSWGANDRGKLGDGTTMRRTTPGRVQLSGVVAVAGGGIAGYAVRTDGTVMAWGQNGFGQLGDGTTRTSYTPVPVIGLTRVTAIAGGYVSVIALRSDGTVWGWGDNTTGQLGPGVTAAPSSVPVQVRGLSHVTRIASGLYAAYALRSDGTVWAWGYNAGGQLGGGTTSYFRARPMPVLGLTDITVIAGGAAGGYAVRADGTVWAWGSGVYGALGDGTGQNRSTPVQVTGLTNIKSVASFGNSAYALAADGSVWAWGQNDYGELGNGTEQNALRPVRVHLHGAVAIASNYLSAYALKDDGTLLAWGAGPNGELGNGTRITKNPLPLPVSTLTGVTAIAAGVGDAFALTAP